MSFGLIMLVSLTYIHLFHN